MEVAAGSVVQLDLSVRTDRDEDQVRDALPGLGILGSRFAAPEAPPLRRAAAYLLRRLDAGHPTNIEPLTADTGAPITADRGTAPNNRGCVSRKAPV